jgi:hypothetical protein
MDVAIEMATGVTPPAAGNAGECRFEPMERNENGKRRRKSEAPVTGLAHGDLRSHMEREASQ